MLSTFFRFVWGGEGEGEGREAWRSPPFLPGPGMAGGPVAAAFGVLSEWGECVPPQETPHPCRLPGHTGLHTLAIGSRRTTGTLRSCLHGEGRGIAETCGGGEGCFCPSLVPSVLYLSTHGSSFPVWYDFKASRCMGRRQVHSEGVSPLLKNSILSVHYVRRKGVTLLTPHSHRE